jgi:hypothetical protein
MYTGITPVEAGSIVAFEPGSGLSTRAASHAKTFACVGEQWDNEPQEKKHNRGQSVV